MASLSSWLSADVMHALGWTLIHSLWQCLAIAALAAVLMSFSRRPPIRYLIATGALVAMLAAPAATFLILMQPAAPVRALPSAIPEPPLHVVRAPANPPVALPMTPDTASRGTNNSVAFALVESPKLFLPSRFLPQDFLPPGLLPWLVGAWLCGVALFSLRLAGGVLLLELKRRGQSSLPAPDILALCQALQRQLGLDRAIRYLECDWLQAPAVMGWLRPIILLPVSALTGLSEAQLRAVIAHELAHIRRHDFFVNLLQILVETLLFYHPAIWWLNKRIRAERELCCDEIAVSLTGDRLEYAKVLTLMAEWQQAPALVMAANRGPLSQRIFHILGRKPSGAGQRMLGVMGSILFLAAALAAANALFGIANPIPVAEAKTSLKIAPPSSRIAADRIEQPILPAQAPPAKDGAPDQDSGHDAIDRQAAAPDRTDATTDGHAEKLAVSLPDLSALLPTVTMAALAQVAANDLPRMAARTATRPRTAICALPTVANVIDLKTLPGSDLRTVPVAINGEPKQFLLDIGTHPTEVSKAAAADLSLPDARAPMPTSGHGTFTDISYSQSIALYDVKDSSGAENFRPRVRIASFTVGGVTGQNLTLAIASDPAMGNSKPYDGLMTGDLFRQYDVELDFARNRLNYLTPTACTDPDQVAYWPHAAAATIPMASLDGKIQVQVSIQGQVIPAVIDTSSAHTVIRRDIAEMMLGLKADTPDMMPDGDDRDGSGMQIYRHIISQISFAGGVTAYNVPALIQTSSMIRNLNRTPVLGSRAQFVADPRQRIPGLTLGMDVLHQLHLYIVRDQQKLYVTSAE